MTKLAAHGTAAIATAVEEHKQNNDPFAAGIVAKVKEITKASAAAGGFTRTAAAAVVQEKDDQDDPNPAAASSAVTTLTSALGS